MPALERDSRRIVIAGASSLLGAELKSLLEESHFAGWDIRLVDEEFIAGTLTEAAGEPAVILPVEEDTFLSARIVFFTGSPAFTLTNLPLAMRSASHLVDLSGAPADREASCPWFPELPGKAGDFTGREKFFTVSSAPAAASALLSLSLKSLALKNLAITHFRSVSEAGRRGIEELETQTSQLLSMQPAGEGLFGTQIAFALLDKYGSESKESLGTALAVIRSQTAQAIGLCGLIPAIHLVQVPVFYGASFSALAEIDPAADVATILQACREAGFRIHRSEDGPLGNLTAAAEYGIFLAEPRPDPARPGLWWFWGAADNIRLPAWNAIKLAEKLSE